MSFGTKCWWRAGRGGRSRKSWGLSRLTVRQVSRPRPRPFGRRPGRGRGRSGRPCVTRVRGAAGRIGQWTGGKQRLTATRLHELLVAEGHRVGVTLVKEAVAEWKRQRREVFVPLTYRPGDLAEVDFFEVLVDIDGVRRKAWLFLMRLMYSGRDFAWIYERQDQISFLDGHVRAFAHFDGVPARVAYDNLRAAVVRILVGGARTLTPRFSALASHYLLEAVLLSARRGPRQRRRRSPRQGDPAAGAGPDSDRADAGDDQCDAARAHGCARRHHAGRRRADDRRPLRGGAAPLSVGAHAVCAGGDDAGHGDAARVGAPRGRVLLGADALGRLGSGGADGRDDGDDRRPRGHADSASAPAIWAAVDRLPALPVGARAQAAGGAPGAAGSPTRSRRAVSGDLGSAPRGARAAGCGAALCESARAARHAGRRRRRAGAARRARRRDAAAAGADARRPPHRLLAPDAVPAHLRDLEIPSGCAADYDGWLVEVGA